MSEYWSILMLACLAACSTLSVSQVLSVEELIRNHGAYNGKVVRVRGHIIRCAYLSCELRGESGQYLSIGDTRFDNDLNKAAPAEVIFEALFNDKCARPELACTDRPPTLIPQRLISIKHRALER
jgi:hypothetical protein